MEDIKFAPLDPIDKKQELLEEELIRDIKKGLEEADRLLSMTYTPNTGRTNHTLPEIYPVKIYVQPEQ